ncbi:MULTISPECIES: prephenate dehydrogenase/arogenate dehydrogenase family protein [Saliphagus]|uniref:Prephenate dehydrogenase/arogenate dehydrogenase family protein n=1 Tax=Saliphagus infecundisoli TaxID=1849069 RepID=A0ABD5Q9H8_9EURY|nr:MULTISPECIES: prephenate dehydrogenase/arogenate dehydrogenase family protein [Saliphagus]
MEVLIVGAGAMGRWFAGAVDATTTFTDVDGAAARRAADACGGRACSTGELEGGFDAVCLAVPIPELADAVEQYSAYADDAVLDVSGVMGQAVEAMAAAAPGRERVSLHPLFAPERAPGTVAVVRDAPGPTTEVILGDVERAGNELVETTPREHDEAMETVQAATHAAVLAFALAADPAPAFSTPVYDRMAELAGIVTGGTPRVYADIQESFPGSDRVAEAAAELAAADRGEFETLYGEATARWEGKR